MCQEVSQSTESHLKQEEQRQQAEDLELIVQAQKGCHFALEALCEKYRPLLLRHSHILRFDPLYEDLFAYLSLILVESVFLYDPKGDLSVGSYFKSRIKYGSYNQFRHYRKQKNREQTVYQTSLFPEQEAAPLEAPSKDPLPEDLCFAQEQLALVKKAMHQLTPFEQAFIYHYYECNLSLEDIGATMGRTRQNMAYHHKRILAKLTNLCVELQGSDEEQQIPISSSRKGDVSQS